MNEYKKAKIDAALNIGGFMPITAVAGGYGVRNAIKDFRGTRPLRNPYLNAAATGLNAGTFMLSARDGAEALSRLKKIKAIAKAKGISKDDVTKEDIKNYNEMVKKAYEDILGSFEK